MEVVKCRKCGEITGKQITVVHDSPFFDQKEHKFSTQWVYIEHPCIHKKTVPGRFKPSLVKGINMNTGRSHYSYRCGHCHAMMKKFAIRCSRSGCLAEADWSYLSKTELLDK